MWFVFRGRLYVLFVGIGWLGLYCVDDLVLGDFYLGIGCIEESDNFGLDYLIEFSDFKYGVFFGWFVVGFD